MKNQLRRKMRATKRGFTLAEAVIAMAIILIISAVALSAIVTGAKSREKARVYFLAVNEVSNVLECYKASEISQIEKNLEDYYDKNDITVGADLTLYYDGSFAIATAENFAYRIEINATYDETTSPTKVVSFQADVYSSSDNEEIYSSPTYYMGGLTNE